MRNHRVTVPVVIAFLAGCVAVRAVTVPPAHAEGPAVTRWEYTCTYVSTLDDSEKVSAVLTAFGKEGWELATAFGGSGTPTSRYCFKRPM